MPVYTVQVNRKLIAWALTQSSTQCAIAQALLDANDDWQRPWVTQKSIGFTDRRTDTRYSFETPPAIAAWITQFDQDPTVVKPFTFEIDAVKEVKPARGSRARVEGASILRVKPAGRGTTPQEAHATVTAVQRPTVQRRIADHERYTNRPVKVSRGATSHRPLYSSTAT